MQPSKNLETAPFIKGGGEIGDLIRKKDWSKTSLGDARYWPQSLRTTLSIIINSKFPMFLFWGPDLICFYNDAYRPSLGNEGKHPGMLGEPAVEFWKEIWQDIKPLIDQVLVGGEANWTEDQLLPIYRNGRIEDVYWTYSYSPVNDETGNPAGVFVTCTETTEKVQAFRHLKENQDRLSFAIDASDLATWEYNPTTGNFNGNHRLKAWFGLPITAEIPLQVALDRILFEDRKPVAEEIKRVLKPGSTGRYDIEFTIVNPMDHARRLVRARGRVLFGENKKVNRLSGILQDQTKKAAARLKLEKSEAHFRALADNMTQLVWMSDKSGYRYWYNKRWYEYTGSNTEEMLGWGWIYIHHAEYRDRYIKSLKHCLSTDQAWEETVLLRRKDGEYQWFLSRAVPIKDGNGEVTHWHGSNTDITEQKQLIELLAATVNRLKLFEKVVVNTKEAVLITAASPVDSPGPKIIYINEAFTAMTGYTAEEVIGKTPRILQGPKTDRKQLDKVRAALQEMQSVRVELINYTKNGEEFYVEFEIVPVADEKGEYTHFVSVQRDITDRKRSELQILESEKRFRLLAETLPQLVWVTDEKGVQNFASKRWKQYTGLQPTNAETWAAIVHPDDLEAINSTWGHCLQTGDPYICEVRLRSKKGEYRWFRVNGEPLFDKKKNIVKWMGAFTDIHYEKTFNELLKRQVEDRTNELLTANDLLVQQNEELAQLNNELQSFNYISSHDLQEPLRKIQTFISRIMATKDQTLSGTHKDYFQRIQRAANRMQALIQDLLSYSRASTQDRKFEKINLHEVVEEIRGEFKQELDDKNVLLDFSIQIEWKVIHFQLRQLFSNLISNSIKFAHPDRQPQITITGQKILGNPRLHKDISPKIRYCQITFQDNGIGFEQEFSNKIFEVFQRLHGKEHYEGTGVGLAIVKRIVENHSGYISVHSVVGQGTTFQIFIPEL